MQIDFHYYCIFVLANLAGFSKEESRLMAYSSQYVDDATESKPLKIGNYVFDTVRTAHNGLRAKRWSVCKKVIIPFHFLPPEPVQDQAHFSYITQKNSVFVQNLLEEARAETSDLKLYRLGIALHTFADSWAHQGFSGRAHPENNLAALERLRHQQHKCPLWWYISNIATDILYGRVGHLQALKYPDYSHADWLYKKNRSDDQTAVQNAARFLEAAEKIFFFLAKLTKIVDAEHIWQSNRDKLSALFLYKKFSGKKMLQDKCRQWQQSFADFFSDNSFEYDAKDWKKQAMIEKEKKNLAAFRATHWAKFHRAALMQRFLVLQQIT